VQVRSRRSCLRHTSVVESTRLEWSGRRANSGTTAPPEQPRLSTPEASMGPMLDGYMPPLKPRDPPQLSAKRRTRRRKEGSD
jgi:hypothetical protein